MPFIYDLFGRPLSDRSVDAEAGRKARQCPFSGDLCDGGGNRYQTKIDLKTRPSSDALKNYFNSGADEVVPGVCSIDSSGDLWVVCPRRLFGAKHTGQGLPVANHSLQNYEKQILLEAGVPNGVDVGIWSEVNLAYSVADAEINYHFDYVAAPLVKMTLAQANALYDGSPSDLNELIRSARTGGLIPPRHPSAKVPDFVLNLPDLAHPFIFEVMTASTSGSNTKTGTNIASAFENAILGEDHTSPGINKRQVWGRMVTQLFAKTALARAWKGDTFWIVQDELLRDMELTTLLDMSTIGSNPAQNLNFLVMHYDRVPAGGRKMDFQKKISVDSGLDFGGNHAATDVLLPGQNLPKVELLKPILRRQLAALVKI